MNVRDKVRLEKRAKNKLTAADWVVIADGMEKDVTVYMYNGNYHMIHTELEPRIHPLARVVHRSRADVANTTMRYIERADYVREETINPKGEVLVRRYRSKSKGKNEEGERRTRERY